MEETPSAESRSIDDQIEWLDDEPRAVRPARRGPPATLRPDLWVLPLDGTPQRVAYGASSPVAVGDLQLAAAG